VTFGFALITFLNEKKCKIDKVVSILSPPIDGSGTFSGEAHNQVDTEKTLNGDHQKGTLREADSVSSNKECGVNIASEAVLSPPSQEEAKVTNRKIAHLMSALQNMRYEWQREQGEWRKERELWSIEKQVLQRISFYYLNLRYLFLCIGNEMSDKKPFARKN
jgi:hypothetical protein